MLNPMNTTSTSKKEILKKNFFDYIDDVRVNSIFKDYTEIKEVNKGKINDFMKKFPKEIKSELTKQETNLKLRSYEEQKFQKLSEYLSKKLNKKPENLLVNRTDEHRMKREFGDFMDSKVLAKDNINANHWIFSLRKPKNKQAQNCYVNMGNKYHPSWVSIKDNFGKNLELIRKPKSDMKYNFKGLSSDKFNIENYKHDSSIHLMTNIINSSSLSFNGLNGSINDLETSNYQNSNNINNSNIYTNTYDNSNMRINNMNNQGLNDIQVKNYK